ncbi:MAG: 30S ribosomal protein S6 [Deltaproteobacteria bacterium]
MVKGNYYETLYLFRPDIREDELKKVQDKLNEALGHHEAEVFKWEKWSERDLAYPIDKYIRGIYYIIVYKAATGIVAEMEKNLRFFNTDVLRFITVKIKEDAALREKASSANQTQEGGE